MAFTRVWDNSQPPDSQAANLMCQDIRDLKTDTQQRMAPMSGLDANKPLDFGPGFAGVVYFATDTGASYCWNGTAWIPFSHTLNWVTLINTTTVIVANPPAGVSFGQVVTLPANTLQQGSFIEVVAGIRGLIGEPPATVGVAVALGSGLFTNVGNTTDAVVSRVLRVSAVCGANNIQDYWDGKYNDNLTKVLTAGTGLNFAAPLDISSFVTGPLAASIIFNFLRVSVRR